MFKKFLRHKIALDAETKSSVLGNSKDSSIGGGNMLLPQEVTAVFTANNAALKMQQLNGISINQLALVLTNDKGFMNGLSHLVSKQVLEELTTQYDFEPSDKYQAAIADKQKYINQLDAYLEERKNINLAVENDLQQFLHETTLSISRSLESFSTGIKERILEAENRYGIDKIKHILLTDRDKG